jgi:hypothetical protein
LTQSKGVRANRLIEQVLIWRCAERNPNSSTAEIAQLMGKPQSTVRKALRMRDVTPVDLLKAYSLQAVESWLDSVPIAASKGDHKPSRDLLLHANQIQPVTANSSPGISIVFAQLSIPGLPGVPALSGESVFTQNANVFDVSDVRVTVAAENDRQSADSGRRHPLGDPTAAAANTPGILCPESNG